MQIPSPLGEPLHRFRELRVEEAGDPRLADYVGLRDADARRAGVFIAESELVVREVLGSRYRTAVRSVLVSPARRDALADALDGLDAPVYVAERDVLKAITGFDLHRGAVAAVDRPVLPTVAEVLAGARSVAVFEAISDHENLGVLFRNAAGLGVGGVLLDPTCCDPLYRRTVRVSMGHVLTVPWTRADAWPAVFDEVRAAGFSVVALTPDAGAEAIDSLESVPDRVAIVLGTESTGLSPVALAAADRRVRIPMAPGVDSLNVAAAAAIAFHRLAR